MKKKIITSIFLGFFLIPLIIGSYVENYIPVQAEPERSTFNAIVTPNIAMDVNRNKIHDDFEALVDNGYLGDMYTTIATFNQPLTNSIRSAIEACGGQIISSWSVIYGAAIRIKGIAINSLANIPEISFLTEDYKSKALLSTSVPQINVRPYVWDTLGYEGDSTHALAIIDTGIDDTHPDVGGAKLVYWEDFVGHDASTGGDEYATATDWNGHGTHVASIAAGTGTAGGTSVNVEITGTLGLPILAAGNGYARHFEVETAGSVQITVQWDDKAGNNPGDTMFIMVDTNGDGAFTGADDPPVTGDYSASPLVYNSGVLDPGYYLLLIGPYEDGELGRTSVQYKIVRPASTTADGNNKYRGVAPNNKLVGLKALDDKGVGTQTSFINALDWVYENGTDYDVNVVVMSLGFDAKVTAIDNAVNNLVSEGYVCVVAAGNGYMEGDEIYSPGTAVKAITVGAIDDVDKVAIYSSNGLSGSGKPDVVAPGGAFTSPLGADEDTHPVVAADTNDKDVVEYFDGLPDTYWEPEQNTNDYIAYQGTSMSTPHVAGLVSLMIQAMGVNWTHTEANVMEIKNILCGTATELGAGEIYDVYSNIPTLNRGDRDLIEGFGKIHGDAAIEAFLTKYTAGSIASDSLGSLPSDKQSWARRVELKALIEFTAGIEMDGSADFDLYLYDPSVNVATATGILTKSVTNGVGLPENILYTPASDMTAYLVVKRVSGSGSFTLQAEATKTGTPSPSFLFGVSTAIWAILGTIGLTSIVLLVRKRHK